MNTPVKRQVLRSWPWTLALAGVLTGFLLLAMVGLSLRTTTGGRIIGFVVIVGVLIALYRVLTSGVQVLPSGLIVRELTRSTPVPWPRIRSITTAPTARKGVYAPVLQVGPARERAGGAERRGARPRPERGIARERAGRAERSGARPRPERGIEKLELTILASYSQEVAKRRTEALLAARRGHTS